jgi:hypothetical protein
MATKQEFFSVLDLQTLGINIGFALESAANASARRLAIEHPGHEYVVLQSVRSFKQECPQPTEYEHGDYPF